ncbi:hypothetical protein V5R04_09095 [Jonesiaceae bacterium BS-20]|uniref:Uncharacterized protein n=1 Tax=Jonesiaceae bacterium BS-20 TaxID=3120821 RepID=A0AAU7DT37_9MICO
MGVLKYFNRLANAPDIRADPLGALAGLPRGSAAEFRVAAWPLWYVQFRQVSILRAPSVKSDRAVGHTQSMRHVTGGVLFFLAAVLIYEVFDASNSEQNRLFFGIAALVLVALGAALFIWKRHDVRKILALIDRNEALIQLSWQVDQMVAAGQIPLAPLGWQGPVPPPLTGTGDEYFGWPRPWQSQ